MAAGGRYETFWKDAAVPSSWKYIARYLVKGVRHRAAPEAPPWAAPSGVPSGPHRKAPLCSQRSDVDAWPTTTLLSLHAGKRGRRYKTIVPTGALQSQRRHVDGSRNRGLFTEGVDAADSRVDRLLAEQCDRLECRGSPRAMEAGEDFPREPAAVAALLPDPSSTARTVPRSGANRLIGAGSQDTASAASWFPGYLKLRGYVCSWS